MTVGAQEPQVGRIVVARITVNVIQMHDYRLTVPHGLQATLRT